MENGQQPPDQFLNPPAAPDPKVQAQLSAEGTKSSGLLASLWAWFWSSVHDGSMVVATEFADSLDEVLTWIAGLFVSGQGEKTPHFWPLVAAITEDLTGVPVDVDKLKAAAAHGRLAAMSETGGSLLDLLSTEFISKQGAGSGEGVIPRGDGIGGLQVGELTPEQGVEAARRFLGFGMSFAIRQGNIALLTSILPESIRIGDGFREYGEMMAKNLGLGRLTRLVLRPHLQEMVVTPLEWAVRKQYRPTMLSEGQAVKAMLRGFITQEAFKEEMARRGYSDERIQHLVELERQRLPVSGLERLVRYGMMTQQNAVEVLQTQGWSAPDAALALANVDLERLDGLWSEQAAEWRKQFVDGVIDATQLRSLLSTLPITDREKKAYQVLAATKVELPRKFLTLAQVEQAFEQGLVDLEELRTYLHRQGYSLEDSDVLVELTLLKLGKLKEAAAAKAARAEKLAHSKTVTKP